MSPRLSTVFVLPTAQASLGVMAATPFRIELVCPKLRLDIRTSTNPAEREKRPPLPKRIRLRIPLSARNFSIAGLPTALSLLFISSLPRKASLLQRPHLDSSKVHGAEDEQHGETTPRSRQGEGFGTHRTFPQQKIQIL
jgi:hypothetical protein